MSATLVLISLGLVACLCTAGTLSARYDDNLLQRAGMAGIALSSIGLFSHVWEHRNVTNACGLLSVSMAMFAIGVAAKVVKYGPRRRR